MSDSPRERVFVYGTLKRGFCNHDALLAGAEFLGAAMTVARHGFYLGTDEHAPEADEIPYLYRLAKTTNEATLVHGEVWAVSPLTLRQLDRLEGHPNWYRRESIRVQLHSEDSMEVQAYLRPGLPPDGCRPIESGRF
jgi:gamma-glutamylaminecyclotransferase